MDTEQTDALDTLIQEKLDSDADFQASLADLSEDEQAAAIDSKRSEIVKSEYASLLDKAKKAEEVAENQKKRAEKAEKASKKEVKPSDDGEKTPTKQEDALSSEDLYSLIEAKVPKEDIKEVQKAAKVLGLTIDEALKDDTVQSLIKRNAEKRATANATSTKPVRPGAKKVTDAELLAKAAKGEFPEKGTPEAEQLFFARHKRK